MPHRDDDEARARQRRRYRRQRAERVAAGRCAKCGRRPTEPDRTLCAECGEKRRAGDRARYARARQEGRRYGGADAETRRRSACAGSKRRYEACRAAGVCVKCGRRPSAGVRSRCEPCLGRRNAAERDQWSSRRAAGLCGVCAAPAPDGAARCQSCAASQAGRPSRAAYARKIYARRRAQGRCTDCGEFAAGASRCPECARRSHARSAGHRGLPAGPPTFRVVVIDTGETLDVWDSLAEARASVAFAGLNPDAVTIEADIPPMTTLTSW